MKQKTLKILVLCLVFALIGVISVSAAKYPASLISGSEDYENFAQPGDMDANGSIDIDDEKALKKLILVVDTNAYSDTNGDGVTNICDLVFQQEQIGVTFIENGKINLNGKSVYSHKELLTTGGEYQISGADGIELVIKDNGEDVTVTNGVFKAPLDLDNAEISIIAKNATVENLKITRVNMDNDVEVAN